LRYGAESKTKRRVVGNGASFDNEIVAENCNGAEGGAERREIRRDSGVLANVLWGDTSSQAAMTRLARANSTKRFIESPLGRFRQERIHSVTPSGDGVHSSRWVPDVGRSEGSE
jgi:hypothetical protein